MIESGQERQIMETAKTLLPGLNLIGVAKRLWNALSAQEWPAPSYDHSAGAMESSRHATHSVMMLRGTLSPVCVPGNSANVIHRRYLAD